MKDFFKNHGLLILFATAIVSVLLAVSSYFGGSLLGNLLHIVFTPFQAGGTSIAEWFNDKQNYYKDTTDLQKENEELRRRIAEMEGAIRQAESDSEENKNLRELLNLREQRRDLSDIETARVTEHSVTNWTASITIDKGTMHGIEVGNCVIDPTGAMIGSVSEVGTNWATVLTLVDTDTSLGAQVFRTKELGIARGEFSLMQENKMRIDYLPVDCQLLAGDLVVTSGFGGFYPPGLVIGMAEEVMVDDSGSASYAILVPQVDFDTLTQVAVIKSFEIVT